MKSNRPNSSGPTSAGGRMQRIVSQAGFYAASRLSSDSNHAANPAMMTEPSDKNRESGTWHKGTSGLIRYRLPGTLTAISISPDNESIAVAGREVLKILSVTRTHVREMLNLRAGSHLNINYSSNDVKWGNNVTKNKIATAATSGAIVLWDINRTTGKRAERVISEHSRAVNRVCFQPDSGHVLLSASQDGTMKGWDLRDPKSMARYRFEGKSESVRDVQFNPLNNLEFAAAFETGTIQKWDMRYAKALYDRKVSAHNGPCWTVDWHPNGRLVASGGRDKTIKVWDMSVDSRRPLYTIRTMASVARIQWRPGYDDEIASCSLLTDNRICVWDIRRPHVAKYAFNEHESTPTGFLWLDTDVLYSCAKDKNFIRQEIQHAYEPTSFLRRDGMGWNIQGDLAFAMDQSSRDTFVDERITPRPTISQTKKWRKPGKIPTEEEAIIYIPPQSCGIAHLPLFDFETFSVLAQNYAISSEDALASCEKNSEIAWKLCQYRTAQTWKIVALLFKPEQEDESCREASETPSDDEILRAINQRDDGAATDLNSGNKTSDNERSESDAESLTTDIADLWPTWQHEDVVTELLDYYTEQGDVQMCVTLYLVLQNHITVDDERIENWFTSYIDLLNRFKLWTTAAAVINACPIGRIRERNENATTINIACNNCFKLVMGTSQGAWACDKCRQLLNGCSICHQTVRGLYVWCQGCNHGGHLGHMREWFTNESLCPTGCGHSCILTSSNTSQFPSLSHNIVR
ncbi:WD40-repeat-containing domain protein [Dichotomocladium elegans]|nr:WD40-repeat-containing domain protein [Dichotomocladium elegans]